MASKEKLSMSMFASVADYEAAKLKQDSKAPIDERKEFEAWAESMNTLMQTGTWGGKDYWICWQAAMQVRHPQWISVDERLPDYHDCYVIINDGENSGVGFLDASDIGDVKYWMPLPLPPNQIAASPKEQKE